MLGSRKYHDIFHLVETHLKEPLSGTPLLFPFINFDPKSIVTEILKQEFTIRGNTTSVVELPFSLDYSDWKTRINFPQVRSMQRRKTKHSEGIETNYEGITTFGQCQEKSFTFSWATSRYLGDTISGGAFCPLQVTHNFR